MRAKVEAKYKYEEVSNGIDLEPPEVHQGILMTVLSSLPLFV